jgi:integrase
MRAYAAALEGIEAERGDIGSSRTIPGSFNALCVAYYQVVRFPCVGPGHAGGSPPCDRGFPPPARRQTAQGLTRAHIHSIVGAKAGKPGAANNLLKALKVMLAFAVDISLLDSNPAIGIKKYKSRGGGFHVWSEAEVERFRERHPTGSKARLALELLLGTAQRRSDVVRLGWQAVRGTDIAVRQQKTDRPLLIPMHPDLVAELAVLPKTNLTFVTQANGAPYSAKAFGEWFRARCNEAGLPQCSAHGLRKLAATRLADAGCSASEIAAITGHRDADRSRPRHQCRRPGATRPVGAGEADQSGNRNCPT